MFINSRCLKPFLKPMQFLSFSTLAFECGRCRCRSRGCGSADESRQCSLSVDIVTGELIFLCDFSNLCSRYWWLELKCVFQPKDLRISAVVKEVRRVHTAAACFLPFYVLVGVFYDYIIWTFRLLKQTQIFEHLIVLMLTDISEYIKFFFF